MLYIWSIYFFYQVVVTAPWAPEQKPWFEPQFFLSLSAALHSSKHPPYNNAGESLSHTHLITDPSKHFRRFRSKGHKKTHFSFSSFSLSASFSLSIWTSLLCIPTCWWANHQYSEYLLSIHVSMTNTSVNYALPPLVIKHWKIHFTEGGNILLPEGISCDCRASLMSLPITKRILISW